MKQRGPDGYRAWFENDPRGLGQRLLRVALPSGERAIRGEPQAARRCPSSPRRASWALRQPRMHAALRAKGRTASRGRIERLMRRHGIHALAGRRFRPCTTDSRHNLPVAPNLLKQEFVAEAPNRVWLAGITHIATGEGWLCLAAVLDLATRKIVGWSMRDHMRTELPLAVLMMAAQRQRPADGLICHSDRGSQYASEAYGSNSLR